MKQRIPVWGLLALAAAPLAAQTTQVVKPPVSQAWLDVATYSGFGMPMGAGANPMAALGGLFGGGGGQKNSFGNTQAGGTGRWLDVTLYTRQNPNLNEAVQAVPEGFMAPALKLQAPKAVSGKAPPPEPGDERVEEHEYERPKAGC